MLMFLEEAMNTDSVCIQTEEKQNLSFSDDLPVEIRLQIYGHLFNIPGNFFELWAPRKWTKQRRSWREDDGPSRHGWAKNSSRQIAHQKQGLRMMRLCKKIRTEVVDYFYGGNNFRFSSDNGIAVMAAFFYTIRPDNCSFLRHITVQIPNRQVGCSDGTVASNTAWDHFSRVLSRRGMRVPRFGFGNKQKAKGRSEGEFCYDKSVYRCFRQLREMPNLKRLEITIPYDYEFLDFQSSWTWGIEGDEGTTHCSCPEEDIQVMSPEDRIWHTVREHTIDDQYWNLLADLKENAASDGLAIALVIHDNWFASDLARYKLVNRYLGSEMRQARWIAAYASLMGYEFGHTYWETKGPGRGSYRIRYDEDPVLAGIPKGQDNSLLEPPELPKHLEEGLLPEPTD